MASLYNADEVRAFLVTQGFLQEYNDGLLQYLRAFYFSEDSLPDLLARYVNEYGLTLTEIGSGNFLTTEIGDTLTLESGDSLILEA